VNNIIDLGDANFCQFNACVGNNGFSEEIINICKLVLENDITLADFLI
jgi:hypothetical protein